MAKPADKVEKPWQAAPDPQSAASVATQPRGSFSKKKAARKQKSCAPCRTTRLALRALFWYAVFLLYWKCPYGTPLDTESPTLCGPLHCGIQRIEPVVKPYYDTYAEPYVMLARPYYTKTKELNNNYVVPAGQRAGRAGLAVYNRFLAPHVDTVYTKGEELYESHAREHHEVLTQHYNRAMQLANQQYEKARIVALTVYMDHVQPVLVKLEPHYDRAVRNVHSHVCPRVKAYSYQLYYHAESLVGRTYAVVSPKIQEIWDKNVEPQLVKIRERVSLYRHKSQTIVSTAGTVIIGVENPTETASEAASSVSTSVDTTTEAASENTLLATPVEEIEETASATEDADEEKITPFKWPGAPEEKDPAESALQYWKKKVTKQLEEAQLSLNEEVNAEKARLLRLLEPQFTEKLQHLSDVAQSAYITIDKVVADIIPHRFRKEFNAKYGPVAQRKKAADEEDVEDEYDEEEFGTQIRVEPADVQSTFKAQADLLREGAMDVRELASELAQTVIDRTEKVRLNTLEVLDEFAEFALKELAKTVVNTESFSHWKEYKQVKDSIIEAKEKMEKSDIPMEDVNGYLREVQETANHLAREAAQALNGLRSKSDFYFQERHRMEDSERVAKGEVLADETPEGVEFYEPSAEEIAEEAASEKKQRAKAPFVEYDIEEEDVEEEDFTSTYTMTQTQTRVVTMSTDPKPEGTKEVEVEEAEAEVEEDAEEEEEVVKETAKEESVKEEPVKKTASSYGDFDEEDYEDEDDEYDY
ncbi:hypothetical protein CKK34_3456 [Yarrowia sp. E02]|nr:hypothetical protein CKK34_3456 [Yarrowia sp. E02]